MTTTHTFQGLNADSKPSSRVLNPPGGSSSNIFGFGDQPKKQDPVKSNQESVAKGTNDALTQGPPAATAGPQQKSGVPKSGDDSFHTPFGIYQSTGYDKAPSNNGVISVAGVQISKLDPSLRNYPRSKYSDANTFLNIFGEGAVQQRKMFRRIHSVSDDSFSRVFGQRSLLDYKEGKEGAIIAAVTPADKLEIGDVKAGLTTVEVPINTSQSNSCNVSSKVDKMKDDGALPIDQVFFRNPAFGKGPALFRRLSPRSAFNPITGEPYEQSKPKQETPLPTVIPSESRSVVESTSVLESTAAVNIAEPEQTPTPAVPAPTTTSSAAVQQKQQQQNGLFSIGTAEDAKEHRSTRVTQPPGGRSTKLW